VPAEHAPARRWGFRLYALHLLTLPALAVANVVAGLTVLSTPWTARGRRPPPAARPLLIALGVYALLLLASIAASYSPAQSWRAASELFTLATLVLALYLVRGEREARWIVAGLVVVAALAAAFGLVQLGLGYGGIDRRIRGPFSHWMTFAHFLMVCDCLLIGRLAAGPPARGWRRLGLWAALAAINLAIVGSLTRSVWVALAFTFTLLLAVRAPRWLLAYLPAAALVVLVAPVPLLHRMASVVDLGDPSNYDRLCMVRAAARMTAERPLLGLGPEMVRERYAIYREPTAPRYGVPHLHNNLLQLAAERGLPALAAYLAMTVLALAAAARGFRAAGGFRAARAGPDAAGAAGLAGLHLGTILALVAFNLGGLFEYNWGDTEVQRLALFALALPYCAGAAGPGGSRSPSPVAADTRGGEASRR
jgi:O-antigen ligase